MSAVLLYGISVIVVIGALGLVRMYLDHKEAIRQIELAASNAPQGWKQVGWWHQADDPDECDFFFADAINGDCPRCYPCYAAIGETK